MVGKLVGLRDSVECLVLFWTLEGPFLSLVWQQEDTFLVQTYLDGFQKFAEDCAKGGHQLNLFLFYMQRGLRND